MSQNLRAGTAIVDISPEPGVSLAGYPHHPRHNTGIHDPLYASCLCLDDGDTRLAIIAMDLLNFSKQRVQEVRAEASRRTGIPAANITISCSHSHSSPRVSSSITMDAFEKGTELDSPFARRLTAQLIGLIEAARRDPFEARVGVAKGFCGREQGVGGNRRDPMGVADAEVWTIGVQDATGTWRAALVKYALHPTFLHSDNFEVSADYPGAIRSHLASTKPGMVLLFAQGTSGNQSPRYFRLGKTFAEAERVGTAIGREADRVLNEMTLRADLPLTVSTTAIDIDLRELPDRQTAEAAAERAKAEWERIKASGAEERDVWNGELQFLGAEDTLSLVMLRDSGRLTVVEEELPAEIHLVGIGDSRMVGVPGELFVEFGLTIQYRSPFPDTFVVELANGGLPGYGATRSAYAAGGYETGASLLTGRSGEQIVDAAVKLLLESHADAGPARG